MCILSRDLKWGMGKVKVVKDVKAKICKQNALTMVQ